MSTKSCHDGHRDRLRKRFLNFGADCLCEHELLELILFYGIPRKNTNEIAHALIKDFGDLNGIFSASADELQSVEGIGASAAAFIKYLGDMCNNYRSCLPTPTLPMSPENFGEYFKDYFKYKEENFCLVLCPDTDTQILFAKDKILHDEIEMHYIINKLVKKECNKIIIGINHGKAPVSPQNSDFSLIRLFYNKLSMLDVEIIDCIIVNKYTSFSIRQNCAFSLSDFQV